MDVLITACNRNDLLEDTIRSLKTKLYRDLNIVIHEDSPIGVSRHNNTVMTGGIGQHKSIEKFLEGRNEKYYIHLEEDWHVDNRYDWISHSIDIMEEIPTVLKVLATNGSPHPCEYGRSRFGILRPWQNTDSLWWCGFSWNPGVTRLDLLKKFVPFKKWEQEIAADIHDSGYLIADLEDKVFKHTGHDRSTHHKR